MQTVFLITWFVSWIVGTIFYGLAVLAALGALLVGGNDPQASMLKLLALFIVGSAFMKLSYWADRQISPISK